MLTICIQYIICNFGEKNTKKLYATFAYFSVTATSDGVSTAVTATAAKMPVITIETTESSFGVSVTAEDMAKPESDNKSMWGIVDHEGLNNKSSDNTVGWWAENAQKISIIKMTSTSGSETETYECPVTITATLDGTMKESLEDGDAKLYLYGPDGSSVKIAGDSSGALTTEGTTYDLSKWKNGDDNTIKLNVQLTGNDPTGKEIKADLEFINKNTAQNYLAGKNVTVTLTTTGGECKVIPSGE